MARPDPRILDDVARVAGGAINIFSSLQQQMRQDMRSRMDEFASRMDLVPREDFEKAESMILKLRQRLDAMESRLEKLEGRKVAHAVKPGKAKKSRR